MTSVILLMSFLLIVFPKVNNYFPEGNWLPGPLWLLLAQSQYDQQIGLLASLLLAPALIAVFVQPNIWTAMLTFSGFVFWIGFGVWLAMLAVM